MDENIGKLLDKIDRMQYSLDDVAKYLKKDNNKKEDYNNIPIYTDYSDDISVMRDYLSSIDKNTKSFNNINGYLEDINNKLDNKSEETEITPITETINYKSDLQEIRDALNNLDLSSISDIKNLLADLPKLELDDAVISRLNDFKSSLSDINMEANISTIEFDSFNYLPEIIQDINTAIENVNSNISNIPELAKVINESLDTLNNDVFVNINSESIESVKEILNNLNTEISISNIDVLENIISRINNIDVNINSDELYQTVNDINNSLNEINIPINIDTTNINSILEELNSIKQERTIIFGADIDIIKAELSNIENDYLINLKTNINEIITDIDSKLNNTVFEINTVPVANNNIDRYKEKEVEETPQIKDEPITESYITQDYEVIENNYNNTESNLEYIKEFKENDYSLENSIAENNMLLKQLINILSEKDKTKIVEKTEIKETIKEKPTIEINKTEQTITVEEKNNEILSSILSAINQLSKKLNKSSFDTEIKF